MTTSHLEQFASDLHQEVLVRSGDEAAPQLREEAFTEVLLERLSDSNEADGADICTYESRGAGRTPPTKVNAWSLSGDGATLDLFVARYHGDGQVHDVSRSEIRRSFELLHGFLTRSWDGFYKKLEESSDAFQAALRIHSARESLASARLFLLTDGIARSVDAGTLDVPGLKITPVVWDLEKLSRQRVGERQKIELDFQNVYGGPLPCLESADSTGEYRTFLAFLRASVLARIYGEYGQRLLERNVRAFLQARGKVNRGLQRTLKEEPHRFLAYNNGLCCTAASVEVQAGTDGHGRLLSVSDFQIVNGGQTTASIFHAKKKEKRDVGDVVVQVKLTVLSDPAKVGEIVPLISRFANSQNKVNTADFSANGPFHRAVEQFSRAVWAPAVSGIERQTHWYYERARGSYADDRSRQGSPAKQREWETQNPRPQMFTKTDLAKFELAWLGLPHMVCLGAEKSFLRHAERLDDDGEPIVDLDYFKHLVAKAILFRTAEKTFSSLGAQGYRAQSVAYAVAWLAERSGQRIDLGRTWEQQRLSPVLCAALRVACASAHEHIMTQPGNLSEAAKREPCWQAFRATDLPVGDGWKSELAAAPFVPVQTDEEALVRQWETLRQEFAMDTRTIADLEVLSGRTWVATRRGDPVSVYASRDWSQLRQLGGLGMKKLRGLVELLAAAGSRVER